MLSLIIAELEEALISEGTLYAYHTGKAGGVAAATGSLGMLTEEYDDEGDDPDQPFHIVHELCDDISYALEDNDSEHLEDVLIDLRARRDYGDESDDFAVVAHIGWAEYGAALNEAVKAREGGDGLRYALMMGFVSGLMFNNPGPYHPEHGTILDAIATAYETGSDESLKYAQARIAAGVRMSDPTPFMQDAQYDRYHAARLRMMRWLQNFGLGDARAGDEEVAIPNSMAINHAVRQQAREPHDATAFISQGNEKRNRGDYDGAIADFDRAIEIDPDNAGAYHGRGEAKRGKGDYDGAITDCDRAIELDPDDPGGCNIRGMSKWQKGDYEGAITDFDRAIEVDPGHTGAYYIRGMIKEEKSDYEGAIADFDHAIGLDSDDAEVYNHRAFAKWNIEDYEGAIADFSRVIELEPDNEYAQRSLSILREHPE